MKKEKIIMEKQNIKIYTDYSICQMCKGICCQRSAGLYTPSDIERMYGDGQKLSIELLVKVLSPGFSESIGIDYWEGDARPEKKERYDEDGKFIEDQKRLDQTYYLRPKHKGSEYKIVDAAWGGVCVNWSEETGCSLTEDKRPYQCRVLIPNYHKVTDPEKLANLEIECDIKPEDKGRKQDVAISWIPYQKMIEKALDIIVKDEHDKW